MSNSSYEIHPPQQCSMIQVQMNLRDPDSPSLQAHLCCETLGLGPGKRERETQEGRRPGQGVYWGL